MIPILLFGALATAVIYALSGGKDSYLNQARGWYNTYEKVKEVKGIVAPKNLPSLGTTSSMKGQLLPFPPNQPPLSGEAQRLLAYLVLFARDKPNPPGSKKFLSYNAAGEAVAIAHHLGLHKTARAIKVDAPVPDDEYLPGRTVSIRQSVISYGTTGKA